MIHKFIEHNQHLYIIEDEYDYFTYTLTMSMLITYEQSHDLLKLYLKDKELYIHNEETDALITTIHKYGGERVISVSTNIKIAHWSKLYKFKDQIIKDFEINLDNDFYYKMKHEKV